MSGKGSSSEHKVSRAKSGTFKKKHSISEKSGLSFPVGRIRRYLREGNYADRVGLVGAIFFTAALEYIVAEILELAGNVAKECKKTRITPKHIQTAIREDEELHQFIGKKLITQGGVPVHINQALLPKTKKKVDESHAAS